MARKKNAAKDPVTTIPASVSPDFEEMIVALGNAMERSRSWLGGKLLARGYLAILEGEKLLSEDEIKSIINDKDGFERALRHANHLLMQGIPIEETHLPRNNEKSGASILSKSDKDRLVSAPYEEENLEKGGRE
jgi:hypothetical protein